MEKIKIIIADDSPEFRNGLKQFLIQEFPVDIIGEASNGEDFLKLPNLHDAEIILMDIMMPKLNGINATKKLLRENPGLKVIAVTMHAEKAYLIELVNAGFKGCIFKNNIFDEITEAIAKILNNELHFPNNLKLQ